MKLTNPTEDELNAAFAEKVAGYTRYLMGEGDDLSIWWEDARARVVQIQFTTSADAVLPWLEKWPHGFEIERVYSERYAIRVMAGKYTGGATRPVFWAEEKTFPRSAVIVLLRANGVEIEFT